MKTLEQLMNLQQWALEQWGESELGDSRRNERAVAIGRAIAANPSQSLPQQMGGWNELRSAYRLCREAEVSHAALSQVHWGKTYKQASAQAAGVILWIEDISELNYNQHKSTQGLGKTSHAKISGLMLHSGLAVVPEPGNICGVEPLRSRPVRLAVMKETNGQRP